MASLRKFGGWESAIGAASLDGGPSTASRQLLSSPSCALFFFIALLGWSLRQRRGIQNGYAYFDFCAMEIIKYHPGVKAFGCQRHDFFDRNNLSAFMLGNVHFMPDWSLESRRPLMREIKRERERERERERLREEKT